MRPAPSGLAGVPLLSHGFRLFFVGAAVWAILAMAIWLGVVTGAWPSTGNYPPVAWHAHELLFGYVSAAVAGFLLTAVPNWTGRMPVRGGSLLVLFLLWVSGRVALLATARIGLPVAMIVDSLFLVALALLMLREIVSGANWRNLKTVALVVLLSPANIAFHVEVYNAGVADYSLRLAIALVVGLIMLIGGRIVPSFTRNWLARRGAATLPVPFGQFDVIAIAASGGALALWVVVPGSLPTSLALLAAGALQLARMLRWEGLSTWQEPLVFVLHGGYAFVPLGFLLVGASILWPGVVPPTAALHGWSVGSVALMTLAVMTRASLGHTGHALTADIATRAVYLTALTAVISRIAAPLLPSLSPALLAAAAICWIVAFGGFALAYGPLLARA